jgi:hypothetical protein
MKTQISYQSRASGVELVEAEWTGLKKRPVKTYISKLLRRGHCSVFHVDRLTCCFSMNAQLSSAALRIYLMHSSIDFPERRAAIGEHPIARHRN